MKRSLREISAKCMNTWRESANKIEPSSFQQCLATEVLMGIKWNTAGSLWIAENTFSLCMQSSTGTYCTERLWSLLSCRYAKVVWERSWANDARNNPASAVEWPIVLPEAPSTKLSQSVILQRKPTFINQPSVPGCCSFSHVKEHL